MPYYPLYRASAEMYLWIGAFVSLLLCVLGWLLLGRAASKHLYSFTHWFLPSVIGGSFIAAALLLTTVMRLTSSRDYALGSVVYFLSLGGLPFHIVSFARLWQTITALPPSSGEQPPMQLEQDAGVWPPQPRR